MNKIRRNVFETNSSSVHSIVITKNETEPRNDVVFELGEFGWECEVYDSTDAKATYFYTAACSVCRTDVREKIRELLEPQGVRCIFKINPNFKNYGECFYLNNGSIDHSDDEELKEFVYTLLGDASLLVNYLFNPDSFVVTYNDNMDYDDWNVVKEITTISYPHLLFVKGN